MQNWLNDTGRLLIFLGIIIIFVGALFSLLGKVPFLGKLPGDILIQKKNFTFYFPLVTCILLSLVLSLLLHLFFRK
ncbi:DUF2905 domain-containing protein [candidate division KSB1 bacterium]|nr:DUF2905 domain-containing protein [bacterium]OQX56767.1 MAG: hypothetical protein B5M50_06975 [candidate division KSB1 bacterium 4484_219]RKY77941.1 MAG: DUF2905 domain-containing protein [candidate division KSB1 bacterium]RKY80948.1 MAG: DUF2905 domain-containing protein [candidate division KSB1 bacterium]RKY86392.1 MAG: DUF2905 domain-containing protein [candidate division KSB1 bacterium]